MQGHRPVSAQCWLVGLLVGLMMPLSLSGRAAAAPASPGTVLARALDSMSIGIDWTPVAGALGYRIYRSTDGSTYTLLATQTGELNASYLDLSLAASAAYFYKVAAYDHAGESAQSAATQHSQAVTQAPGAPRGIAATGGDRRVTIGWNANPEPNIAGYLVYRSPVSGGVFERLTSSPLIAPAYTDATVSNTETYYYRVTAVDSTGREGEMSPERWAKPQTAPPSNIPHSRYTLQSQECATCHRTHRAPGAGLLAESQEVNLCYSCHNGTGSQFTIYREFSESVSSRHPVPAGDKPGSMTCTNCHNPHLDYAATDQGGDRLYPKLLEVTRNGITHKGNEICTACHGVGSPLVGGNHETAFAGSSHNAPLPDPPSGTQIKCSDCHLPHSSASARLAAYNLENGCFQCHYADVRNPAAPDIWDRLHTGAEPGTRHDLLAADQLVTGARIACTNCHSPHGVSAGYKSVNPDSPAPGNRWEGTVSQLCLACHDGSLPTGAQTQPYAPAVSSGNRGLVDIQEAYHLGLDNRADQHGEGIAGATVTLDPAMGWERGEVLPCTACHEPHGTPNAYNLRSTVFSKDGTQGKGGLLVLKLPGGGADLRFFCGACHGSEQMGNRKPWPTDCLSCHKHGSGTL